jgi:hypothetical protein
MSDTAAITRKARAELENLVDELVLTLENGLIHPDGSPGFVSRESDRLRSDLRAYAQAILAAARHVARGHAPDAHLATLSASVDAVVETIRRGVLVSPGDPGFGTEEADTLRESLKWFGESVVTASAEGRWSGVDRPVDHLVRAVRSGVFLVYGRRSYAAITGDQLEAYLRTFADAVLAVVEKEPTSGAEVAVPAPEGP